MAVVNLTPSLPNEVWNYLFSFFSNPQEIFKVRLVCRDWQNLILISWKDSYQDILDQFLHQKTMSAWVSDLTNISQTFRDAFKETPPQMPKVVPQPTLLNPPKTVPQPTSAKPSTMTRRELLKHNQQILKNARQKKQSPPQTLRETPQLIPKTTPQQLETAFWQAQGKILTIFKKLTQQERDAIKAQMPPLRLFDLETMTLIEAIQTKSFETFSIVFAHCPPSPDKPTWKDSELHQAIHKAAAIGYFRAIRVLIDSDTGFGSATEARETVTALFAWKNNHLICAASLITKENQCLIAGNALETTDVKFFNFVNEHLKAPFNTYEKRVLVAAGEKANLHEVVKPLKESLPPISDRDFAEDLEKLITNNNLDLFKRLLDSRACKETWHLRYAAQKALKDNKPEFAFLLLEKGYKGAIDIIEDFLCHRSLGLSQRLKVVKFLVQHRLQATLGWIFGTVALVLALAALCYFSFLELAKSFRELGGFVKSLRERIRSMS